MPIDSNIALSFKPVQIQNPLEQYAQVQQIQAAQNHNRLADLMFGEKQREIAADNALAGLLASGKSGSDITNGLASQGFGNKAIAYTKQLQETEKQKADIAKTNAEAGKFNVETAHKKLDIAGQAFGFVRANPTLENAHATLDYLGQQGIYTPEQVSQYKAQVAADPSKISALADQAFRSALSAKDQLAKYETRNTGGSTDTIQIDPVTGKTVVVNSVKNTQSPDNAATVAATIRGQNMTDSRARELNAIAKEGQQTQVINDPVRGPILVNKATGVTRQAVGANGQPVAGEVQAKKEASAKSLLPILDEADKLVDGATGSYVGYGVDQTARAFGKVTEGSKNVAQLKVLEGNLMLNQPRMEGPQSDKDVMMYRQMAGQIGDPTVPREIKKAALSTIRKITEKYAGVPQSSSSAAGLPDDIAALVQKHGGK